MCIICNAPKNGDEALMLHLQTASSMIKTADSFEAASEEAQNTEQKKRYKSIAYKIRRMKRDWNRLEEEREYHPI